MTNHHRQLCYIFLLSVAVQLIDATIPTIDNIVQVLQSPAVQQIVIPQSLIAADPIALATENAKPVRYSHGDSSIRKTKPQADGALTGRDENPTLKLVTRVLDTFRAPLPTQQVLLIQQRNRALPGCPLCDASVYSYCDYKVYHDGCCCGTTSGGYGNGFGGGSNGIGYGGCGYKEDCSFIYANSCYEHQLIVNCCCNSPY
ncbi:uncharacterized protein LOC134204686 [Armigeres subalbatus]|uniref:uncharacterized protein LOC134204686 n=1 Tax=Armigeres subalbatus TaxID=124917 RepID=UPI002ED55C4A